ncbi:hypothetical protein [Methylocystis parvus]|uniref:Uncharacterized protein n=1 Tax=Methylocystis parvus TaxID=134 RepID=A0A6B8M9K9_9HYPH|nr:hypothetical protein [Methylocystis parvus]QGM97400.1 hypothetical protein F7D14_07895 [Methylocystis parvus]WBJ98687.1 hypothetical protein MMG94_11715 [Methylocystis parvus OBBP]
MKPQTIDDISSAARVSRHPFPAWMLRRRRLERLAELLEAAPTPARLFVTMECYPRRDRLMLRQEGSPLFVAFADPLFRREGLTGDSVADGVAFFGLSLREAHALLCDCGYGGVMRMGAPLNGLIAARARRLASKRTFAEWRDRIVAWI